MDYKAIKDFRTDERAFMRGYAWVVFVGLAFCVISRAPVILGKASVEGMDLRVNVGYPVLLGPFVILALVMFHRWAARHIGEQRTLLPDEVRNVLNETKMSWGALCFLLLPSLAAFFLAWQSIVEVSPATVPCAQFSHWRMLWDFSLWETQGRYCFGLEADRQHEFPYLYAPVAPWLSIMVSGYSGVLGYRIWQALRA